MSDEKLDYSKIGLKCGLEIHQQINTSKLFCNCPSLLRRDEPDFNVMRKLHAVAGESGEIDTAAKYQASLKNEFIYQGYNTTCLVELDESPPREINENALKIALQIALLLNAKILPITQIMRKTVIDGSNTSGFQRTVLIAVNGFIETSQGRVGIDSICLEEDAARIISREENKVTYRLDRLGIPLVEIATAPDIKSPEQAKEVALFIGNVLRRCDVKRGLGTIRQDVNVSIRKGKRIEIKGFQDVRNIGRAIELEARRQSNLVKNRKEFSSEVRKVLPNGETEFLRPMPGEARMYPETDLPLLRISRELLNDVKRTLPKMKHETEQELKEKGLNDEMIKLIFKEEKIEEFKDLLKVCDNSKLIAKMILIFPKDIAKREKVSVEKVEEKLDMKILIFALENFKKGKISESQVKEFLEKIVKGERKEDALKFRKTNLDSVEEKIIKIIKEKPGLSEKAYMGLIMKEFKGAVIGKEVMEIIKKYVS
ncbi:Glu-tRNA(Gln) amidotransferase GatDE subunit E [Candidatus Pacearchaeota archaeon CG10_big_fil_rev_8_21_14_0_10_34_12]|nr:MAG: Glu-tRNA(Gln) amidotransferase GatDE subunit E [Candidatus Pacearchaeota archaeon CG10_big_fil_rev_8_21_14_0_10_34_12]